MSVVGGRAQDRGESGHPGGSVVDKTRAFFVAAVLGLALGGCGGVAAPVTRSTVEADLPQKLAPIIVGESRQADVRSLLGQPWITSDYWRFDLFRLAGRDAAIGLIWVVVPVPVANLDTTTAYVLVTYDAEGRVFDRQQGLAYDDGMFGTNATASVRVVSEGHVGFAYEDARKRGWVHVGPDRRHAYLKDHGSRTSCSLMVGCTEDWCQTQFAIDGGAAEPLPDTVEGGIQGLVLVRLVPGEHRIAVRGMSPLAPDLDAHAPFSCAAGEERYAAIQIVTEAYQKAEHTRYRHLREITVTAEEPLLLAAQPLMVWREGQWLVPQEPGR